MASSTVTLVSPTLNERKLVAKGTWPQWGGGLDLDTYIAREIDSEGPLNRDGGLQTWMLTEAGAVPDNRPILSSCDTLRKRALVREKDGTVRNVLAQGVASVFTPEVHREKGYCGKMMALLNETLKARANEDEGEKQALFSVLYSDVGKQLYARRGWKAMPSSHFTFDVDVGKDYPLPEGVRYITKSEIAELTARDEKLLRDRFASIPQSTSRPACAILPDEEHMLWHFNRENLKAQQLYPSKPLPDVHGALVTLPSSSSSSSSPSSSSPNRIWALWSRKLQSTDVSTNSAYFLRFVVEAPDKVSDEELGGALEKIVTAARKFAKENECGRVQMWTPEERVKKVIEGRHSLGAQFVVRESDSIVSLNWLGEESVDDVDWILPEQYTWC